MITVYKNKPVVGTSLCLKPYVIKSANKKKTLFKQSNSISGDTLIDVATDRNDYISVFRL